MNPVTPIPVAHDPPKSIPLIPWLLTRPIDWAFCGFLAIRKAWRS